MASDLVFRPESLIRSWEPRFHSRGRGPTSRPREQPLLIWLERTRAEFGAAPMTAIHSEAQGVRRLWRVAQTATRTQANEPPDREALSRFFTTSPEGVLFPALALGIRESWQRARMRFDPIAFPRVRRFALRLSGSQEADTRAEYGLSCAWEHLFLGGFSELLESVRQLPKWLEIHARRGLRLLDSEEGPGASQGLASEPSTRSEPWERIARAEEARIHRRTLLPALLALPERERAILWWLYAEALPVSDLARRCKLSRQRLWQLAHRTKKAIRQAVQDHLPSGGAGRSHEALFGLLQESVVEACSPAAWRAPLDILGLRRRYR